MLLKKPPPQISDDKSDFDKQLDAFIEELKELREDVLHKKNLKRLDLLSNILLVEVGILFVVSILLEIIVIVKIFSK